MASSISSAATAGVFAWQRGEQKSPAASIEPPKAASAAPVPMGSSVPVGVPENRVAAPPVITPIDSQAIADNVEKRLAQLEAANSGGKTAINVDSIRKRVQREFSDSIARANAQRVAAVPTGQPVATPVVAAAAPAPAPASLAPPTSGKKRLAITDPKATDQPALNSFSRTLIDALRVSLGNEDAFGLVDQDSVRDVVGRTKSREEAARILKPDVMVSPGYVNAGDAVNIIVTVWDLRSNSSYGIRVTATRLDPAHPENYLGAVVQSVMKQLDDLSRETTIYRR